MISVGVGFVASATSQKVAHDLVIEELGSVRDNYQILVDGRQPGNARQILSALQTLQWLPAHHSNPTKRIILQISDDSRNLVLWLARDSGNPREYWVFYPKYRVTASNEIGRIITPIFDGY